MLLPRDLPSHLRALVRGPLPAWPRLLDDVAERWFRLTSRLRLAVVLVAVVGLFVGAGRIADRSPWGADLSVLVTTRDLAPGHTLGPGDLVPAARPEHTVPHAAVPVSTGWVDSVTTGPLPRGSVVAAAHLADGGLPDLVASGRVAVAVPAGLLPPLDPGRRIDLIGGSGDPNGQYVARDGRVLAAGTEHVWIEVDRVDAAAVSAAVARGSVTVALLGS